MQMQTSCEERIPPLFSYCFRGCQNRPRFSQSLLSNHEKVYCFLVKSDMMIPVFMFFWLFKSSKWAYLEEVLTPFPVQNLLDSLLIRSHCRQSQMRCHVRFVMTQNYSCRALQLVLFVVIFTSKIRLRSHCSVFISIRFC